MPRASTVYVCSECGGESPRWAGQCPHCRAWNTLQEFRITASAKSRRDPRAEPRIPLPITEVPEDKAPRRPLQWNELNRVLGGGIVNGSLVLLGGEPGIGKSTLLMEIARQVAAAGSRVLYVSGEESAEQVRMRAARLGALDSNILMLAENDLDTIIDAITSTKPELAVVDSIQTVYDSGLDSAAGSVSQVREGASRLMRMAKSVPVPTLLAGHVTKEGAIAGPRVLEHVVDTVLYLEGESDQQFRVLRATKNRFGSTDEVGIFAMAGDGLHEIADASALLLEGSSLTAGGTVVLATVEGTRPLLVEIQSLVAAAPSGLPRRSANGVDPNRLYIIVAVIDNRARLKLGGQDIFVNVAGGLRVTEPAADLGIALSLVSNLRHNQPLPERTVVIGELGLTGEVRRVNQLERRLAEAARHGFRQAIVPAGQLPAGQQAGTFADMRLIEVRNLSEAIASAFSSAVAPLLGVD